MEMLLVFLWLGVATCDIPAPDISKKPDIFESNSLPMINKSNINERYMPTIGNGHIATNMYTDTVYVNGLYNGFDGTSHRGRIPAYSNIELTIDGVTVNDTSMIYRLDVRKGVFTQTITTSRAVVMYRAYAHQFYNRFLVSDVTVDRAAGYNGRIRVMVQTLQGDNSKDLKVTSTRAGPFVYEVAQTREAETSKSKVQTVYIGYTNISTNEITLETKEKHVREVYLLGADLNTPVHLKNDANVILALIATDQGKDELLKNHTDLWMKKWNKGRIELTGNLPAQKAIYASLYYLYSSLPSMDTNQPNNQYHSLSPGSLSYGAEGRDYNGHVFWDAETWMYPGILMFRPDLAKEMLSYRINGVVPAHERARSGGYQGTRFPWESAYTGAEVTPITCITCRENEQHITGDIAFAAQQYVSATRDVSWLNKVQNSKNLFTGYDFIHEMARFLYSRPTKDPIVDKYNINGVMAPDEYASNVNNSVYTNVGAAYSVNYARYAACLAGKDAMKEVPKAWTDKMFKLKFPYNKEYRYHEEYEGYHRVAKANTSNHVKQADVILLAFPYLWNMPDDVRKNDLVYYEGVTDPNGPAMTWSMFSINWLELGNKDKADMLFNKSYDSYVRQPFKIWTEVQSGLGAVNFITGIGGFLQAVVFGYGGIRLRYEELEFMSPKLPPETTSMKLIGLQYLGTSFDLEVVKDSAKIVIKSEGSLPLVIQKDGDVTKQALVKGHEYIMGNQKFKIYTTQPSHCMIPTHFIDVDYSIPPPNKGGTNSTDYF